MDETSELFVNVSQYDEQKFHQIEAAFFKAKTYEQQIEILDNMFIAVSNTENITATTVGRLLELTADAVDQRVRVMAVSVLIGVVECHEVDQEAEIIDRLKVLAAKTDEEYEIMALSTEGLLNFLPVREISLSAQTDLVRVTQYNNSEAEYSIQYLGNDQNPIDIKAHTFALPRNQRRHIFTTI